MCPFTTFSANYIDIYDLADKIAEKLEDDVAFLYQEERETKNNSNNFLKILNHIKENQIFKAGFNAIINKWLANNCKELPEEIESILKEEYKNKHISV